MRTSEASGLNIRPDIWLFPFLNVYGIFAKSQPSTSVGLGFMLRTRQVPEQGRNLQHQSKVRRDDIWFWPYTTLGVRGIWIALDMNFTWNDIPQLSKPAFAYVFGPRFGKSIKLKKPERSIAFWVGGFRLALNSGTSGSLKLNELMSTDGLQAKVDNGVQQVRTIGLRWKSWWNGPYSH